MTAVRSRSFYIEQVHEVTVVCFTLSKIVDASYEFISDELFELVEHLTANGPAQVVLDLWSVRQIDVWGLAMLRAFHETIESRSGKAILCRVPRVVLNALKSAGLWDDFHTCELRGEAIYSFSNFSGI